MVFQCLHLHRRVWWATIDSSYKYNVFTPCILHVICFTSVALQTNPFLFWCPVLSYSGVARARGQAHFGKGSGRVWLDEVRCTGNELTLEQCPKSTWGEHNCLHAEDAGVSCNPLTGRPSCLNNDNGLLKRTYLTIIDMEKVLWGFPPYHGGAVGNYAWPQKLFGWRQYTFHCVHAGLLECLYGAAHWSMFSGRHVSCYTSICLFVITSTRNYLCL